MSVLGHWDEQIDGPEGTPFFGAMLVRRSEAELQIGDFMRERDEARQEIVELRDVLREAFIVLDGFAGDEHYTSPEIVRVTQGIAEALDRTTHSIAPVEPEEER